MRWVGGGTYYWIYTIGFILLDTTKAYGGSFMHGLGPIFNGNTIVEFDKYNCLHEDDLI